MMTRTRTVAVVDDHPMMLAAIEGLLESLGFAARGYVRQGISR